MEWIGWGFEGARRGKWTVKSNYNNHISLYLLTIGATVKWYKIFFFSFVLKDQSYASGRINTKMRRLHIAINECYICISRMEFIPRDVTISTLHVLIDDEMNYIWRKPLHFINTLSRKTTQISLYEYKLFKKSYSLKICL